MPRQRIAVVGLGRIGGVMAAALGEAGRHDLIVCARAPLAELAFDRPERTVTVPLDTVTDAAAAQPVDWVLLCTKAHQTASTAPWLARLCRRDGRIAVLQNGLGHAERVAPFAGGARIVPVIVYFNAERQEGHRVRLRVVADRDLVAPDDEDGRAFAALLEGTGLRVPLARDFVTVLWRKLLLNLAINPVTALTLQRQGVLRRPDMQALALAVLEEAVVVARAEGAALEPDEPARTVAMLLTFAPGLGTSMYFDRLAGRELEVEALTGAVVAAADRHRLPVPLNRALLTLLRAVSDAGREGAA